MAAQINSITREKVITTVANNQVTVDDIFIDGHSLQETLKKSYGELFSKGRFKHFFMVYLGNKLTDIYHSKDAFLKSPIPEERTINIAPLYGCTDGCCVYLYVKVRRDKNLIFWEHIGRNTAFIKPSQKEESPIDWLPSFQPLVFDFSAYHSYFQK